MQIRKKSDTPSEMKRKEIEELGLNAISDYFKINPNIIEKDILQSIHNKAKLAMSFEREINLNKRAVELNYIRVFRLVAEDKKELKRLIKQSLPQYMK